MKAAELQRRLAEIVLRGDSPADLVHGRELLAGMGEPPVSAAVLVPFILSDHPAILLTKRNEHLNRHAGQVSFPGGRIDPHDTNAVAAALREAQEEIALDRGQVEVVGRLGDFLTGTGYRITPVIGLLPPGLPLNPAPDEVDSVFEFPIEVLLDPQAPRRERRHERNGSARDVWVWPHPEHYIWGATAAILVHVAEKLRQAA
jgi:8-oxo-dGTP pyrophosphatase MutT (NUDIX family)